MELYSVSRSKQKRGIKEAKAAYRQKLEGLSSNGDLRCIWQGIQHLTNFKGSKNPATSTSSNLAEEPNHFFACFEVTEAKTEPTPIPSMDILALTASMEIRRVLQRVNPRKAAGPDGIPGRVMRD